MLNQTFHQSIVMVTVHTAIVFGKASTDVDAYSGVQTGATMSLESGKPVSDWQTGTCGDSQYSALLILLPIVTGTVNVVVESETVEPLGITELNDHRHQNVKMRQLNLLLDVAIRSRNSSHLSNYLVAVQSVIDVCN